jgi:hypothetical protein
MSTTVLETTGSVASADTVQDSQASTRSGPFFLSGTRRDKITVLVVTHKPTGERVFVDSLVLEAFRARAAFVENLLDAVEEFTHRRLTDEQRRDVSAAVHRRLLRVTDQLDDYMGWGSLDLNSEPLDEINQLVPTVN